MTNSPVVDTDVTPAVEVRVYIFCPSEPYKKVWTSGRAVSFRNGRLDSVADRLTGADIAYFSARMDEALTRHQTPEYIIWTQDITAPALQAILQPMVTTATSKLSTAAGTADDVRLAEIRLSMMLASPEGTEAPRLSLDERNRAVLMENSRRLVSGPNTSGPLANAAATGAAVPARSVITEAVGATIEPTAATAETEATELKQIQKRAAAGANGDPTPAPANPFKTS